ncbi:MAG TPA: hypothetical protein VJ951_15915, partial [Bacteroidales bacterium]|nr:hypothetical protein [Bacteroidales bacterium]
MKKLRFILNQKKNPGALPIMVFGICMLVSCNPFYESLEEEDFEYVYPKDKEVYFLENGIDTLILIPGFEEFTGRGSGSFGIPGTDREVVKSILLIDSSKYNLEIFVVAGSNSLKFWLVYNYDEKGTIVNNHEISIDSSIHSSIIVLDKEYYDYYEIKADSNSNHLKVAYYNKEYGFLKVELQD